MPKTYEPAGTEVQVLKIKDMYVALKPGENAEELNDRLEKLIGKFAEDGNWHYKYSIES